MLIYISFTVFVAITRIELYVW